jgi:shikimate kinase
MAHDQSHSSPARGPLLVLVGSPGAGKSTVGRRVAERLAVPFADTDALIEQAAGMSVSDIFVTLGEDEFRSLEAAAVARALDEHEGVLALGGGAVMRPETQERLRDHRVVWLRVGLSDAATRVGMNTARPLLLGNVRGTLSTLLEQRTPVYEDVSTDVVETSGRSLREVTDDVLAVVRRD